jgi:hypothetical protein
MKTIGNMVGTYSPIGKTFVIEDENGNQLTGVVTDSVQIFDATPADVRINKTFASENGIQTGKKEIPAYHTTEGVKLIPSGSAFSVKIQNGRYEYTKLQALFCAFNTSASKSVSTDRIAIGSNVYLVNSTEVISEITTDTETEKIIFGITNNSDSSYVIRYFTYKEEY